MEKEKTSTLPENVNLIQQGTISRIQIRLPNGELIRKEFNPEDSLEIVHKFALSKGTFSPNSVLISTFPRQTFGVSEMGKTLRELGLVPSASLILQ